MTQENQTHTIEVNYDLPLEDALKAGGYDWANDNLTSEHFPPTRSGIESVEVHLVHPGRGMNTDEPLKEIDKLGLSPGTIEVSLAFGANLDTRDLQREFPIIALGSVWTHPDRGPYVPVLWGHNRKKRDADLWQLEGWLSNYRFLAVMNWEKIGDYLNLRSRKVPDRNVPGTSEYHV